MKSVRLSCGLALALMPLAGQPQDEQVLKPGQQLIRAMTSCPEPNNPIANGVRALGGDLLVNVRILHALNPTILVADVVASPRTLVPGADTPDSFKGRIRVEMGYRPADGKQQRFYCRLEVFPA